MSHTKSGVCRTTKRGEALVKDKGFDDGKILEYGCGAAGISIYFSNKDIFTVATDLSTNALELVNLNAKRFLNENSKNKLFKTCANAFNLPFGDNSFDIVMSYGFLEHIGPDYLDKIISEVVRVF